MRMVLVAGLGAAALVAAGCGTGSSAAHRKRTVVAAFYPLAWAAEQVGGHGVDVRNLTPAGAEPHDVELAPRDVERIQKADVVLYLSHSFQPAVEHAVDDASGETVDALAGVRLRGADPHVWLDPVTFARIVRRVGDALGRPRRGDALATRVRALDGRYRAGLAHCARREFVTSHAAFGYLAARYDLRQVPITGIDPEAEPSARKLRDLARLVKREHLHTVFFETLVSPRVAQTVAREAGVRTAVLDPIEGLTPSEQDRGDDYLTIMRRNLRALRKAMGCR